MAEIKKSTEDKSKKRPADLSAGLHYLLFTPAISLTTSPARISPATAGTKAVLPGTGFRPAISTGSSEPAPGVMAGSWE